MKRYDMPEKIAKVIWGLCAEKCRLRDEGVRLKALHDAVMRRFRDGKLAEVKARALSCAIHARLELIKNELLPLVERRANDLALAYADFVRNGGGRLPGFGMKMPAWAMRPYAGDELRN